MQVGPTYACSLLAPLSPALPPPWLVSGACWSTPVLALLVPPSGYLVVFATARLSCFAWCVVTVWLRSSLLFMATKASALCGAPPSTPCCGCCFGALPSCTEGFTLVIHPVRTPLELHVPLFLARAASPSCPCCLPGRPLSFPCWPPPAAFPLSFFVCWPPLLFSLPLCFLVCCLVPRCVGLLCVCGGWFGLFFGLFWPSLFVVFCWWFGGCVGSLLTEVTKDY